MNIHEAGGKWFDTARRIQGLQRPAGPAVRPYLAQLRPVMLQFAAPLGLLTLGALLAPIMIHLVRRPRRVVKVGSLRPLEDARRQSRSLRWHELWLLALRCALLAALALSLAGPTWQPRNPAPVRWLLLIPGAELSATNRIEWERLRNDGFEPRMLAPDFPRDGGSEPTTLSRTGHAWSLLRELDQSVSAGSRVVVFGPTWSNRFSGSRPTLENVEVSWRETEGDNPEHSSHPPVRVGVVAAADREEDARYVRAAMSAVGATLVQDGAPDWIFQLGDVALPAGWQERVTRGGRLVTDAPNAAVATTASRSFEAGPGSVRITKLVTPEVGVPVLRDSAGGPIFTEQRQGAGAHWRFALRFHPDWTDWPLEASFPAWWRNQLHADQDTPIAIGAAQAAPRYAPLKTSTPPTLGDLGHVDLRRWLWALAVVLFVAERVISIARDRPKAAA